MIALLGSGCCASRVAVKSEVMSRTAEVVRDTVQEQVMVAVYDTLREVTVVTVDRTEAGDTVRVSSVTDRFRGRDREAAAAVREKVVVRTDTVYVEKASDEKVVAMGPGVEVKADGTVTAGGASFRSTLKWLFFVIVAVIGLVLVVRFVLLRWRL